MEWLQILWFVLIAVLWTGYFFLEGFDFGVGILARFLGRDDVDRRVAINTIGPVWDGNEVWLLTAGGATFAAFPEWYATLFSGFYLPLLVILLALIARGVAFEYRSKVASRRWRRAWDEAIFWGSLLPAVLWGVAFANIVRGVPIEDREFVGDVLDLVGPYALVGGLTSLVLFTLHGAVYLALKTEDPLAERARRVAARLALVAAPLLLAFLGWTYLNAREAEHLGVVPSFVPIAAILALLGAEWALRERESGWAFASTGAAIVLTVATLFANLYPRVLPSTLGAAEDLTIANAAASDTTLTLMSVVAVVFVPVVLAYQGWTYWVFRRRVSRDSIAGPEESPIDLLGRQLKRRRHGGGPEPRRAT